MKWPSALRRPRAFWVSVCNIVGLVCSMAGVLLLFWYALPNEPPGGPLRLGIEPKLQDQWEAQRLLYDRYAHLGLSLVLLGTFLEAVPPVCTAIGSWRRRRPSPPRKTVITATPPMAQPRRPAAPRSRSRRQRR